MSKLGKRQMEQLGCFTSTAIAYGVGAMITMIYLTDWKTIVGYIPYYNGKFKAAEPRKE